MSDSSKTNRDERPLDLETLRQKISSGQIDTVLVVFPDMYGRLMGKRLTGKFFLDCAKTGTHGCNYLLTLNIEMDPLDGFNLASWDKGFGDFHLQPDLSTLRILPWQTATAMVLCDLENSDGRPVAEAPRSVLKKQLDRLTSQ